MELAESIETINQFLIDQFGIDTATGDPIWRVVWSNDQIEKRAINTTEDGIILFAPIIKECPKYPWIRDLYVLERLCIVPEFQQKELAWAKTSYEPIWPFKGKDEKYVPPTIWGCKFIIDTVYAAMGKKSLAKYIDEEAKNPIEHHEMRINKLQEELFGDESSLQLKTVTGEAVAYTGPSKIGEE